LDCGGDTFEAAIIELSNLVHIKYGEDATESMNMANAQYGDFL
jgi:hypothetical protein